MSTNLLNTDLFNQGALLQYQYGDIERAEIDSTFDALMAYVPNLF